MRERPILFSGEMVKAILDGRKTMTRRIVKPQPPAHWPPMDVDTMMRKGWQRKYAPGWRLWVREAWQKCPECGRVNYREGANEGGYICQHCDGFLAKWKPSIHMFRKDSRITLEVTAVRVERVQDITEQDAIAEGMKVAAGHMFAPFGSNDFKPYTHRQAFSALWDAINGKKHPWSNNDWVWVVEFRQVQP